MGMVRVRKKEERRRVIEEEMRLKREEVETNLKRDKELRLKRDELANQTVLQTSTPKKEEKHLVVSRHEISEEERQEMLRERQEFLRIPKQEVEMEEEIGRTRKYFITQQEIVFYVKDSEGVVRIIHRPLLKREEVVDGGRSRKANKRRSRGRSTPDLRRGELVREEGSRHIKICQEEEESQRSDEKGDAHMANVGVIQGGPGCAILPSPLTGEWRSSGSIFDCKEGCFSDHTVII